LQGVRGKSWYAAKSLVPVCFLSGSSIKTIAKLKNTFQISHK